ncbi:MAG TPA: GDP-mannose 4,6-dehydratase, partial [Vicinamibacterales bacterium]
HCDIKTVAGEVVNIGTGESWALSQIAPLVVGKMQKPETPITYVGDRPGQVFRHTADAAKAQRLLGWKPLIGFEEGLDSTIAWYVANRPWWQTQLWMREIPIITKAGKRELH